MACTVHTRGPNRGIGRQTFNRARDYTFLSIRFVVSIPQKWIFYVKLDKDSKRGNAPSCFDRFSLTFRFFFRHFETGSDGSWVLKRRLFIG